MADDDSPRRPTLAVATIGHHRHGKTTLTAAITRVLAARPDLGVAAVDTVELDRRSGSPPPASRHYSNLSFASDTSPASLTVRGSQVRYASERRAFVHIDCPGRRPWLRHAARCQALADALILVVSAPEGVAAQTREHLVLARALGHTQIVVFLGQCDAVQDTEWLDLVEHDTRELLDRVGFDGDGARIVRGAALPVLRGEDAWAPSVHDLIGALHDLEIPAPAAGGAPLIRIRQMLPRRPAAGGIVFEGRVERGVLRRGDMLTLTGQAGTSEVKIVDLEMEHRKIDRAAAGEFVGVNIVRSPTALSRFEIHAGQVLGDDLRLVSRLGVRVRLLEPADGGRTTPIRSGHSALLIFGGTAIAGFFHFVGAGLSPGGEGEAMIELLAPVHVEVGARFLLRDGNQGPGHTKTSAPRWGGSFGLGEITALVD